MFVSIIPLSVVTVSAANTADSLVAIAEGELGNTNYTKYYGGNAGAWCADFVTWCAQQAGVSSITNSSSCYYMHKGMIETNHCQEVSSPQKGDIVFFYCNSCSGTANKWCHVGIMVNSTTSIDGNYGGKVSYDSSYSHYGSLGYKHSSGIRKIYVRPNYSNTPNNFPGEEDKSYNVPVWKTANSKLDTYDSNGNKESGRWIDAGDNCYIEKVYKNGYAWVKYPTSNGDRWAYTNAFGFSLDKKISYGTTINLGENFSARIRNIQMNKVVTYSNGNAVIGASMNNKLARQIWKFSRNSNGSYRIKSCLNDTCMELHNFGDFDGGNVTCIPANGSTAQNWFICENSDGSLYLRPECSSTRVLDVTGGDAHDGNNMQLWTYNKTDAQMFSIDKCGEVINVGDNFVASIEHTEYWKPLMQAEDGNVVLCTSSQKNMSRILWNFERDSNNGWYTITSYENGKRLEVSNESDEDGANVQCAEARDTYAQYWYILKGWEENGNEYKYIKSACSSKNLDLLYNSKEDGTNIQMWSINGTLAQRFSIYEINGDTTYDISYVDNEIEIGNQTNIIVSNTNFVIQYEFHVIHPNGIEEIIDNKCDNIYSFAPKQAGIYTIFCRVNSPVSSYVGSINDRYVKIRVSNKLGDINADGNINILDATMIQKHSAELELLDDNLCKYADVNGDGKVSVIDATLIQKYSAELISEF